MITTKRKRKKRKKSDFHANCCHSDNSNASDEVCSNNDDDDEDDFDSGDIALLVHGVESDWVEEEMMEDDIDFIKDVLEQKVIKVLQKAGLKKKVKMLLQKVQFLYETDFIPGHLPMGRRPSTQKHEAGGCCIQTKVKECLLVNNEQFPLVYCRQSYKLVKNWNVEGWRKQGIAVTRDSRSRMEGKKHVLSKVKVGLVRKLERFNCFCRF